MKMFLREADLSLRRCFVLDQTIISPSFLWPMSMIWQQAFPKLQEKEKLFPSPIAQVPFKLEMTDHLITFSLIHGMKSICSTEL